MLLPPKEDKNKEDVREDEAEEEEGPQSHLNLIRDEVQVDKKDDDVMEEEYVENDYNLQSKGALKSSDSTSTLKMVAKKKPVTTTSATKVTYTSKSFEKDKINDNHPTASKPTIILDLTQKILGDLKLDYDVVEDLKKMKANIRVFKIWKIKQMREHLHEALQHIQGPQDATIGKSKATLKGKNKSF